MTRRLTFTVAGIPAPQGSKRHVGHGILIESSKNLEPWREAIKWAAYRELQHHQPWTSLDGPTELRVTFIMPRPKNAPKRRWAPDRQPDLDKLIRGICDPLVGIGILHDDAQIIHIRATKHYATNGATPGAVIQISEASP